MCTYFGNSLKPSAFNDMIKSVEPMKDWAMWSELKLTQIRAQLGNIVIHICMYLYIFYILSYILIRLECANSVQLNVKCQ